MANVYQGWVNVPDDVQVADHVTELAQILFNGVGLPTKDTLQDVLDATADVATPVRLVRITVEEITQ